MPEVKQAVQTTLKEALAIGLDEAFTALDEAVAGLTDEQLWAYPLESRHNIVTLVEHTLQCFDLYGCEAQGRPLTFEPEERFDIWHHDPATLRSQMGDLPTVVEERERIAAVRAAVMESLEQTSAEALGQPNSQSWWFEEHPERVRADAFIRSSSHCMAHVRQIWFLRGRLGLTDAEGWPEQHWA